MSTDLRNFLALPYAELEELNLAAKADRVNRVAAGKLCAFVATLQHSAAATAVPTCSGCSRLPSSRRAADYV